MTDRQGVEIDYCPQCRGLWLDRGELDKILEKARVESSPVEDGRRDSSYEDHRGDRYQRDRKRDDAQRYSGDRYGVQRRKKKSPFEFLGDIFEG